MPRSFSATPSRRKTSIERAPIWPLHVGRVVGRAPLGDHDVDASPGQIHGQRQTHRTAADNQHACPHTTSPARWCLPAILSLEPPSGKGAFLALKGTKWLVTFCRPAKNAVDFPTPPRASR